MSMHVLEAVTYVTVYGLKIKQECTCSQPYLCDQCEKKREKRKGEKNSRCVSLLPHAFWVFELKREGLDSRLISPLQAIKAIGIKALRCTRYLVVPGVFSLVEW